MSFDPSGLPTLQNSQGDIIRWIDDMHIWLAAQFGVLHSEIDQVVNDPIDICVGVGDLTAPDCLVPATGVDTSSFSFAADAATPVVPGVLQWPGVVLDLSPRFRSKRGLIGARSCQYGVWNDFTVSFGEPHGAHMSYAIIAEQTEQTAAWFQITDRSRNGFKIRAIQRDVYAEPANIGFIWTTIEAI